jgi:hypothetical protein
MSNALDGGVVDAAVEVERQPHDTTSATAAASSRRYDPTVPPTTQPTATAAGSTIAALLSHPHLVRGHLGSPAANLGPRGRVGPWPCALSGDRIRHSTFCTARLRSTFTRRPCRAGSFGWPNPHPQSEHDDGCPWRGGHHRCVPAPRSRPATHSRASRRRTRNAHMRPQPPATTHPQMEMVVPRPKPH